MRASSADTQPWNARAVRLQRFYGASGAPMRLWMQPTPDSIVIAGDGTQLPCTYPCAQQAARVPT
jgi:hypothetical protein